MIKILFFIETLTGGGAEKVLRTLVNNMDHSQFDVTVMTLWPEQADKYLAPWIHYKSLYSSKNRITHLLYRLEAAANLTYSLRIHGDYDIEVAYLECGATKIMAGSTNRKAAKIAWVHCDLKQMAGDPESFIRKCKDWYAKYHKIVCVSETVKESFQDMFGPDLDVSVLYNVNDETDILHKADAFSVPQTETPTFVSVGRLAEEKGYDRLLEVCAKLKAEGYDFRCLLVGEGPQRKILEKMIKENTLEDSVSLLGFQSNPYPYIRCADFFVCSSRYEGFSTVVTEALILGVPVVTTACSGMNELLGNSEFGLIVDNSTDGIYRGIKRMLDNRSLLMTYETRSLERGQAFRKDLVVGQTEEFFKSMLGVN